MKATKTYICEPLNPEPCDDEELCRRATATEVGVIVWSRFGYAKNYVSEAKKRGLSCGVSKNQSASLDSGGSFNAYYCKDDPDACTDDQLCFVASSEGIWLEKSKPKHVLAAKARNLTCNTESKLTIGECKRDNVGACNTEELCENATSFNLVNGKIYWLSNNYIPFVNEARKRRLNCEVGTISPSFNKIANSDANNLSDCKQNPKVCSSDELCEKTTYNGPSGGKVWSAIYENFVSEAVRRGLDCGVSSKQSNDTNNFETYFNNLDFSQRRQIQFSLQDLGYYKATIDGLWGQGTRRAVKKFIRDNKLTNSTNSYVAQTLNKKAKSQSSTSNSSSTSTQINKGVYKCKFNPKLTRYRVPTSLEFNTSTRTADMWGKSSKASRIEKANLPWYSSLKDMNGEAYRWYRNLKVMNGETYRVEYNLNLELQGNTIVSRLLKRIRIKNSSFRVWTAENLGRCELIR